MDLILHYADEYVLDRVWGHLVPAPDAALNVLATQVANNGSTLLPPSPAPTWGPLTAKVAPAAAQLVSAWPRDYVPRQLISITVLTLIGIHLLYFVTAYASYRWIFNHEMMKHPRFLKNQVKLEIICSLKAFPAMTLLTLPWFQAEVMGKSLMYDDVEEYGWTWLIASVFVFLFLTDLGVYFVHRGLHHPLVYKTIHKPHHKWLIPTPFASHAFHPVDGYLQSVPYHAIIFVLPFHRWLYLGLFVFVNFWSIFIHDSDMITGHPLEKIINGPAHHTLHHLYFTVNYGQYFTWADRVGGSYRQPESRDDPLLAVQKQEAKSKKDL